jgi:hypothetical protein
MTQATEKSSPRSSGGQPGQRAEAGEGRCAEPDARQDRPGASECDSVALHSGHRQRGADRQQDGAGAQHPLGRPGPQGEGGHGPGPAQQRDDEAADEVVAQAEEAGSDRRPEGKVEAAERPAGHQDRDEGVDVPAQPGRDAEPGGERGQPARAARRGLRHPGDDDAERLARQLTLLYDGATVSARMDRDPGAAAAARAAAVTLVDAACA